MMMRERQLLREGRKPLCLLKPVEMSSIVELEVLYCYLLSDAEKENSEEYAEFLYKFLYIRL